MAMTAASSSFNLASDALQAALSSPDKPALLVYDDPDRAPVEQWSYGQLHAAVLAAAGALNRMGLQHGDRVLLRIGHRSSFPVALLGVIAAGGIAVPTSAALTPVEAGWIARDADAHIVVHDGVTPLPEADGLQPVHVDELGGPPLSGFAGTAADDPALLVYTSGTSGTPKGVLHAQRMILGRRPMRAGWHGLSANDILLHAGAFNWTYTLGVGLLDPWCAGATSAVYTGPAEPTVWSRLIEACNATIFAAVPSLYRRILKYDALTPERMPSLRHGLTAGEALHPALHEAWCTATAKPLFEALGMSEISTYISSGPQTPVRPGSPGRPQPGRHIAILPADGGEIPLPADQTGVLAVRRDDPGLMLGYWNRPEETAAQMRGDWFLTGDLARFDAEGYLWYQGRNDDVMNAFGYRVAPDEVEAAITAHPDIAEAGVTETRSGEISLITAFIVPRDGAALDTSALDAFLRERLAPYKLPRRWVVVDALPRTINGKVRRKDLPGLIP